MRLPNVITIFKSHWQIFVLFLLAAAIRLYAVSDGSVMFWYDQARDFTIVRDIAINHDIKIQGPSASGTNDTIYHGVLYYYLLVPFFLLGGGDPQVVAYGLAILGSFAVFVSYSIGLQIFKSKSLALLSSLFLAVSFINTQQATWLSNPQLLVLSMGLFYFSLWKIFFEKPNFYYFILAGLTLGISIQAGFFEIFLIAALVAIYCFKSYHEKNISLFSLPQVSVFFATFFLTVSSMILTQALMIQRHVLTLEKLQAVKRDTIPASIVVENIVHLYSQTIQTSLIPTGVVLLFLIFLIPLIIGWKKSDLSVQRWLLLTVTAPLWLLLVQYRNSVHILIGVELLVYLVLAAGLLYIKKKYYWGSAIFYGFIILFCAVNLFTIKDWKSQRIQYYGIQRGALLSEQLQLIDKTYELANGGPFTISASTNPYGINVTWGYLYDWYGKSKYGYVPTYYGASQVGYFGEGLLPETNTPAPVHFAIMEPDTGLADRIMEAFLLDQDSKSATLSGELGFGTLRLQLRSKAQ